MSRNGVRPALTGPPLVTRARDGPHTAQGQRRPRSPRTRTASRAEVLDPRPWWEGLSVSVSQVGPLGPEGTGGAPDNAHSPGLKGSLSEGAALCAAVCAATTARLTISAVSAFL